MIYLILVPRVVMHDINKDVKKMKKSNKVSLSNAPSSNVNEDLYEPQKSSDNDDSDIQNFSHLSDLQHEETISKMKEVISKLESGIISLNKEHGSSRINTVKKIDDQIRSRASSCESKPDVNVVANDNKCTKHVTKREPTTNDDIKHEELIENTKEKNEMGQSLAGKYTKPACDTLEQIKAFDDTEDKAILESVVKEKKFIKMNKTRRIRILREKKAQLEFQRVKSQLKEMRKQMEEMREQVKISQINAANAMSPRAQDIEASSFQQDSTFLLPDEWCCKWINGQPVGERYDIELDKKSKKKLRAVKVPHFIYTNGLSLICIIFLLGGDGVKILHNYVYIFSCSFYKH